jgi:hypothetical protein
MKKTGTCPTDSELNDYLEGALSGERRGAVEEHLEGCASCLDKAVFAYKTVREFGQEKPKGDEKMKVAWKRHVWLLGAAAAFLMSFFIQRYFLQFLVATVLLGVKWIFESSNARILIMIYEAWKKGGESEAAKVLKTLNDRMGR